MPLMKCTKDGKQGWRYGESGVCYTEKDGKMRAVKQGLAINNGKWSDASMDNLTKAELHEALQEYQNEQVQAEIQQYVSKR